MENKFKRSNRLGRGFSVLILEIKGEILEKEIVNIDIDKIYLNEV